MQGEFKVLKLGMGPCSASLVSGKQLAFGISRDHLQVSAARLTGGPHRCHLEIWGRPCDHQEVVTEMGLLYNCKEKLPWILSKCFPFFCSFYLNACFTCVVEGKFPFPSLVLLTGQNIKRRHWQENIKFNLMPTGTPHTWESQRPHMPEKFRDTKGIEVCETSWAGDEGRCLGGFEGHCRMIRRAEVQWLVVFSVV